MNKNSKIYLIISSVLLIVLLSFAIVRYNNNSKVIDSANMCQDDAMVVKLIDDNINPFTKFKFIKKRNDDCKFLLAHNREDALKHQREEYCSILDSATTSVILVINTYVHEMYDRETASKEFHDLIPYMTPYDYCPQYMDDMLTLVRIKKRLGL